MPSAFPHNGHRASSTEGLPAAGLGMGEMKGLAREVSGIGSDLRELASLEMQMAKAEMSEQAAKAAISAGWGYGAVMMAWLAVAFLLGAVAFALTNWMPAWAAMLVTAGIAVALALIAGASAKKGFQIVSFVPRKTLATIREDLQWLKSPMKSSGRSSPSGS